MEGGEERGEGRVVAEGLADVGEKVDVPGRKNEAPAQLKRIPTQFVLLVSRGPGALAASEIIAAKQVKYVSNAKTGDFVGAAVFVDKQGEIDSRLLLKNARVVAIAQTDGRERSASIAENLLVFAQLRDVLAAKNSSVMAKKNDHRRTGLPQ